jgi:hypothetical protein
MLKREAGIGGKRGGREGKKNKSRRRWEAERMVRKKEKAKQIMRKAIKSPDRKQETNRNEKL